MFLKQNIKLVPYVCGWYAWSHLIPPHTAAMNIVERHIKIMESFVTYPDIHYDAINSKGMIGGPFINYLPDKKNEIEELIRKTKEDCSELIQLQSDIKNFDLLLQSEGQGASLEELYSRLPELLRGMVELVYDMNNNPSMRFIEPLLYDRFYSEKSQFFTLSEVTDDNRPFCLSTPYIPMKGQLELKVPFSANVIDDLMKMKYVSGDPESMVEPLKINSNDLPTFYKMFTENPPKNNDREYYGQGIRVRYFGHACVLLQTSELSILIDPVLGYDYDGERTDRFAYTDLPETIDYVLVTHNHQDHFLFEGLIQLRHRIKNIIVPTTNKGSIADPSMKLVLEKLGFQNIILASEFDTVLQKNHVSIMGLPFLGEHGDLDIHSKLGYYIKIFETKFIFLADSNCLDSHLYDYIFNHIGKIDILFIGMECVGAPTSWLYGPLFSKPLSRSDDRSRRLSGSNSVKAMKIVSRSGCREVCVYAMGMEPWLSYIMAVDYKPESQPIVESDKLISSCRELGLKADRLYGKKQWLFPNGVYELNEDENRSLANVI